MRVYRRGIWHEKEKIEISLAHLARQDNSYKNTIIFYSYNFRNNQNWLKKCETLIFFLEENYFRGKIRTVDTC